MSGQIQDISYLKDTFVSNVDSTETKVEDSPWWKLQQGSVSSAVFIMSKLAIGLGCLSFPQALSYLSLTWGIVILLIVIVINYWSFYIFGVNTLTTGIYEYPRQVRVFLGSKMEVLYNVIIIVQCYLIMICCQIIGNGFF